MSSNFNNSNNLYISNLDSDDFLSQTENDLEELSIWEKAEFNNSPMDYLKVSPNFEDQDVSAMFSSPNMLVQQDFLSLANQYPIFTYPTNSAVIPAITQPIAINPPSNSAHYPPIFSAPSIVTVAIPGNSIDNNGNSSNNNSDDDNNKNNGSKNTSTNKKISSAKPLQSSANNNNNIKLTDQSTNNDSESISPDNVAKLAAEEDKRRRNTAASARFRVKKKLREQVLERSAKEMALKVELYEGKIKELELENKWLRSLIVEKDARLLDVGPADKKQKLDDVVASDDHQNDKINNDNEMVGVEQDFKKIKDDKISNDQR